MDMDDLALAGAVEQANLIRSGVVSARDVIEASLARIEALNPRLNAFRVVFAEQAFSDARAADERRKGGLSLPLDGVAVAIKDDADVVGEVTAWGTDAYGDAKSTDSEVVKRLRSAGAILIGKTNVPEMTLWPWTASKTWGTTRNPWDLARTPGGSSGGSAVAVATGMCAFALGSDGGGSIRYPAALTGIFGLKPQRDRIPLGPDHDHAWNGLTVYGPLTRSVIDAAAFLDATADNVPKGGYRSALTTPLARLRIAVSFKAPPGSLAHLDETCRKGVERAAEWFRALGHHVFEREVDYGIATISNLSVRYLTGLRHDVTTMARPANLDRTTRRLAASAKIVSKRQLRRALENEQAISARINRIFDDADVVLTPMSGWSAPLIDDVVGKGLLRSLRRANASAWAGPWNVIGQPAATIPVGIDGAGLPLAVQICSQKHDEITLLRLAAQFEQAHPWTHLKPPPLKDM
jgi:amidase